MICASAPGPPSLTNLSKFVCTDLQPTDVIVAQPPRARSNAHLRCFTVYLGLAVVSHENILDHPPSPVLSIRMKKGRKIEITITW